MVILPFWPSWSRCPHLRRRKLHRFDDLRIGGAAAEIAGEIMPDFVVVRSRMLLEQLTRHQHEARCAEPALRRARLKERLLHGTERAIRRQMLNGRDVLAVRKCCEIEA